MSVEDKLRIVAESNEPGARVTEVAARHEVYPGLLFSWRRQAREGVLAPPPPVTFVPVRIASEGGRPDAASVVGAPAHRAGRFWSRSRCRMAVSCGSISTSIRGRCGGSWARCAGDLAAGGHPRVWLAGRPDMRLGFDGLARQVQ